jgi:hypothetical protein
MGSSCIMTRGRRGTSRALPVAHVMMACHQLTSVDLSNSLAMKGTASALSTWALQRQLAQQAQVLQQEHIRI